MSIQWFIFTTLVVVVIQGLIFRRWGLKNVKYHRYFSVPAVFEGQEVEMIEVISNEKLLPVPWLRIESKISANLKFQKQFNLDIQHQQFHRSIFSLMPYTRIIRRHKVRCLKRGCYYLNSVTMTCGDLFGFQEVSKEFQLSVQLLVYPKPLRMEEISLPSHSWQGDVTVKRWIVEDPFMVAGVRDYAYGDPLNRINWKATARTGKIKVNKLDFTANPKLMIYLNVDISDDMWSAVTEPERIEKGISYAASIAYHVISRGIEVGFGSNGYLIDKPGEPVRIEPRCSMEHLTLIYEVLAKLIIARSVTFFTFLEQDLASGITGMDFLIITSYISPRMENQIKKLEEYGNTVRFLWLHPQEDIRSVGHEKSNIDAY
ncbi:uncharacterized protein (DUF58 family) [Caldicoprobacter guelmensis]|uniref:DUF58 domain-containing protein n=1 Tax=Caldicoprobacter guelmensis TaxID=1170224 RepID=UPI00195C9D83|nr:DUF58 domain-containing protein [Caldicoprobacter guelmensis]MBM7583249.1 uncharacterized protein (DUF58 family) [Caldicoprobacter guelmensis]